MPRKILYYIVFGLLLAPLFIVLDDSVKAQTVEMSWRASAPGVFSVHVEHNFPGFKIFGEVRKPERQIAAKIRHRPQPQEQPPLPPPVAQREVVPEVQKNAEGNSGTTQTEVHAGMESPIPAGAPQEDPYGGEDIAELDGAGEGGGDGEGVGDGGDGWQGGSFEDLSREQAAETEAAIAGMQAHADRAWSAGEAMIRDQNESFRNLPNRFYDFAGEVSRGVLNNSPLNNENLANLQYSQSPVNLPQGGRDTDKPSSPIRLARQNQNEKDEGDPIDLRTGEFTYNVPLLSIRDPVAGSINIAAAFRSDLLRGPPGPAGAGATHTYSEQVIEQGQLENGNRTGHRLLYYRGDGNIITFTLSADSATTGPFRPMTPLELQQFDFCREVDLAASRRLNGVYSNDSTAIFLAKGLPLIMEKQWAPVIVRDPDMGCRGTWRVKYVLKSPNGGKRIFEGVVQSPDLYQLVDRCETVSQNNWDDLGIFSPDHGELECRGEIDDDFVGDSYDHVTECVGNLAGRYPRGQFSATKLISALELTKKGEGTILHDLADGELVTSRIGTCRPDQSGLVQLLMEENLLVPAGLTLIADRHPPVRTWHGMSYKTRNSTRLTSNSFKVRLDGWHPFGSQAQLQIENMPWDRTDSFTWLAGALGVRDNPGQEHATADGTFALAFADWIKDQQVVADADWVVQGEARIDTLNLRYYRLIDAYDLQWLAAGVVAPLRAVEEPQSVRLDFKYEFDFEYFRQFFSFATALQGFTGCWDPQPLVLNDSEFDPTLRAKLFNCSCCGDQPTMIGKIFYDKMCNMNCMGTQQTRLEDVKRITNLLPKSMTMRIVRANTEIATLNYKFALMRDAVAESQLSFDLVKSTQALRNPHTYKPFRQVFYSTPLLVSATKPGSEQQTTVYYAAPSAQGNCEVNVNDTGQPFRNTHYKRFVSFDDAFVRNPSTPFGRERGWTFARRPQAGWSNCNDLPAGDLPGDLYDNLPANGHVGIDGDNIPHRTHIGGADRYNGPLVLARVDYGVEGAPEWTFRYTLQDDAQQLAGLRSRHNIRLAEVRMNDDRLMIRNVYDNRGRVTQHTLADSGTLQYAYGENSTTVTTRAGLSAQYIYNAEGQLIRRVGWDGTTTEYVYIPRELGFLGQGQLRDIINPDGTKLRYVYGEGFPLPNRVMSHIAGNSLTSIHQISTAGRDVLMSRMNFDPDGRNLGFFDKIGSITKISPTEVNGQDTVNLQYRYDYQEPELNPCNANKPQGNLVKIIYPDGSFEAWKHNRFGQPIFYRNPLGAEILYSYFGTGEGCGP